MWETTHSNSDSFSANNIEKQQAFKKLIDIGWTDAIRKLYLNEVIYIFFDYFRNAYGRNAGLRIDHFLLSSEMVTRLSNAGTGHHVRGWGKTSDHVSVWIKVADE